MKALTGNYNIAQPRRYIRWVVNATFRPLYPRERDPVPTAQEAGWATRLMWMGAENLAPTSIRSQHHPARTESQYRQSNPSPRSPGLCGGRDGFDYLGFRAIGGKLRATQSALFTTDPLGCPTKIRYNRSPLYPMSVKLRFKITLKIIPFNVGLSSVLLHIDTDTFCKPKSTYYILFTFSFNNQLCPFPFPGPSQQ
jgi:hypothetical protein